MHTPLIPVGVLADWGHRSGCAQCDTTHTDNRDASDALYELVRRDEAHIEELSTPRGMAHAQCNEPRTTTTPKIGRSFDRLTRTTLDTHNIRLYARANIRTSLPLWLLVLPHVVTDESVWLGGSVDNPTPFWDPNMHLPSPPDAPVTVSQLRCSLFGYQRNSLAKMLMREQYPGQFSDPFFVEKVSPVKQKYAFDPQSLSFHTLDAVAQYSDVRGGILCDEMGAGKTLICLALILHTRHEVAQPDAEPMASAVTSAMAQELPSFDYQGADPAQSSLIPVVSGAFGAPTVGERLRKSRKIEAPPQRVLPTRRELPVSLLHIAAHRLRTTMALHPDDISSLPPPLQDLLGHKSAPFFNLWPPAPARTSRASRGRTPVRVYVSPTTLVLVPHTLLSQWLQEIEKHCPDTLRVLAVPEGRTELPHAIQLAQDYDVVLMTHARFGREAGDEQHGIRTDLDACPLLQVYWKRVLVDEGNMMAGDSLVVRLCARLRVERRWIVTGTPTQSLVGGGVEGPAQKASESSAWSQSEKKDVDRLKHLLARFLHVPPYGSVFRGCGNERAWHAQIAAAPAAPGEWPARRRLHDMLVRVMVRNRAQDIEAECPLPPLERRTVILGLARHEQQTYNVLQSLITLNAALSHETDRDYFFHPSNRKALAAVMENLALACFHFAGEGFREQAETARDLIARQLDTPGKVLDNYRTAAQAAHAHLDNAVSDDQWRCHVEQGEVQYYLDAVSRELVQAWSHSAPSKELSLACDEMVAMRSAFQNADVDHDDMLEELMTRGMQYAARTSGKGGTRTSFIPSTNTASIPRELSVTVRHSSSTKLNAIMSEILSCVASDKVLVFSSLENVLHEIAGALVIAQIPFLVYVSGMPQRVRNASISAFRHDGAFRCLLMTTHVGGRGLDLHCASRVILAEPVWQLDLESQAVKRAWRMGQKRKVVVSTYAMAQTFEEQLVLRRNSAFAESAPARVFTDDPGMRDFVAHPRFVGGSPGPTQAWNIALFQNSAWPAPGYSPHDTPR